MIAFETTVPKSGFRWVPEPEVSIEVDWRVRPPFNPRGKKTPRLLLRPVEDRDFGGGYFSPTASDSGLFRNFAAMEPTENAILSFANRYGRLLPADLGGDPFAEWEYEVLTMRHLIAVWDAAMGNRVDELDSLLTFDARGNMPASLDYEPYGRLQTTVGKPLTPPSAVWHATLLRSRDNDLRSTGAYYVIGSINARIEAIGVRPFLDLDRKGNGLVMEAPSLVGALWLQFAVAIGQRKSYRQCEACFYWMEMAPNVNRADRRYCSDACRNRAMRQRKKRVAEMRANGATLRTIAKAVGSDVATVKAWLGE